VTTLLEPPAPPASRPAAATRPTTIVRPPHPTRVREGRPRRPRRPLTAREIEVLALIADGKTNEEVAETLGIARHTVKSHMAHILDALGAMNSAHAVAIAHCRGDFGPRQSIRCNPEVSYREVQVLEGVAIGMTDVQVGRKLWVSQHTIKSHLRRIYVKLGVCSRAQAVDTAFRSGLLVARTPARRSSSGRVGVQEL
jgi:DNA-binding CsgD family transcriptional regulator